MRIRLLRKFANAINGIDLEMVSVGDIVELQPPQAFLLIREGWAEPLDDPYPVTSEPRKKP